ncbi:membrane fraction protein [Athelia psychrophila]|uniref:Membrane fraction protein n=1 Tax=Athelia psychrophila TaxID=1759441 RepID=A0A166JXT8_9AGAM|nr:membrane fraction protein [Fibularhizoctonia sp. CBS 109695]
MSASDNSETTVTSMPLNRKAPTDGNAAKPPVWSLHATSHAAPLTSQCAMHHRDGGICCKELKGEDDRTLIDPDVVRDVVIGLSDGLTVPFALTAGLSSLGESKLVILGGVAELIAGAISMGIGGFLASQAERDHYQFMQRTTAARVQRSCAGEMEREVHAVLGPIGVDEKVSRAVALNLRTVEDTSGGDQEEGRALRWSKEAGLTPFLLKFSEGIEDISLRRCYVSAFTIGMGYLVGGIVPLFPYFFIPRAHVALMYSCILTGVVLLIFGAVKARVTGAAGRGPLGYIWGAVSTMLVGGIAAGAAYGIVALMEGGSDQS